MKLTRAQLIIMIIALASVSSADELRPGSWMLEIYRPDAPLDAKHIRVVEAGETFVFTDADGEKRYFEEVRLVDGAVEFEHPTFEQTCRLVANAEHDGWVGTCPPGHEPEFAAGLTVTLRPPKGPSPAVSAAPADDASDEAGESAADDAGSSGDGDASQTEPVETSTEVPAAEAAQAGSEG